LGGSGDSEPGLRRIAGCTVCSNCGSSNLVVNEEFRMVCRSCSFINEYYWANHYHKKSTYKRITHFNERLAQLFLVDPPMAEELYELVENEAYSPAYPNFEQLSKEDFRKICRSIKVPKHLQEKYRSTKFKMRPLTDMNRFVEKWLTLRYKMSGVKPVLPPASVVDEMRTRFVQLQVPFEMIRHKPKCDGRTPKCHHVYKCRHNFINYNFTIIELLRLILKDDETISKDYLPILPQLKTRPKRRQLKTMWDKLIDYVGWGKVYPIVTTARKRLEERVSKKWKDQRELRVSTLRNRACN